MELPYIRYMETGEIIAKSFEVEEIEAGIRYLNKVFDTKLEKQFVRTEEKHNLETLGIEYYTDGYRSSMVWCYLYEVDAIRNRLTLALYKKKGNNRWKRI